MDDEVMVYSHGLVHCSVCVPKGTSIDEIEAEVNRLNPTGLDHGWKVDSDATFADGESNPCQCDKLPGTRLHYLMSC